MTNERLLFTTPFWTLKPNWYLVSGRLIFTSTTGGHGTTVSLTTVADFVFCRRQNSLHKVRAKCQRPQGCRHGTADSQIGAAGQRSVTLMYV
jgi:hypothetical protein